MKGKTGEIVASEVFGGEGFRLVGCARACEDLVLADKSWPRSVGQEVSHR